jgi:hypothetical protein
MSPITVQEIGYGDFVVIKGGDVYRKGSCGPVPGNVKPGETATAYEICEWIDNGATVAVEDAPDPSGLRGSRRAF